MNKADRERMIELCSLIATEQDQGVFLHLVEELNGILGGKDELLRDKRKPSGQGSE